MLQECEVSTAARAPERRPEPILIRRAEAARLAGWSIVTLAKRERSDPAIPCRIAVGANGGAPYAYRRSEWLAYLDRLPRAAPSAAATPPEVSAKASELARCQATPGIDPRATSGNDPLV